MNLFSIVFRVDNTNPHKKHWKPGMKLGKITKTYTRIPDATRFIPGHRIECATLVVIKNITKKSECDDLIKLLENLKPSLK
jgi:hypothetical protein